VQAQSEQLYNRESLYNQLMASSQGLDNDEILACMLSSCVNGEGALPEFLGLEELAFSRMLERHFPLVNWPGKAPGSETMDVERLPERQELIQLLLAHRADGDESEEWIAYIVVAACMGGNHLWQDLGLWSRKDLSELMQRNFPALAAKNDKDMKWKKFLYKQLCIQEGIYTCRAPSCEVCVDYQQCFGPED
jgi:nitrogen fixation protein NifQ